MTAKTKLTQGLIAGAIAVAFAGGGLADERQAEAERRADERQREADRRADDRVFWQNEERKSQEYLYRYNTILNEDVRRNYPRRGW